MTQKTAFFVLVLTLIFPLGTVLAQETDKTINAPTNMSSTEGSSSVRIRTLEKFKTIKEGTAFEEIIKVFGEPDGDPSLDPQYGKYLPIYFLEDGSKVLISIADSKVKSVQLIKQDKTFVDITAKK